MALDVTDIIQSGEVDSVSVRDLARGMAKLDREVETLQVYNCLDNCITREVWDKIVAQMEPETTERVYNFERAMQAPSMEMTLRGVKVDQGKRQQLIFELEKRKTRLQQVIDTLAESVWGKGFNPQSPKQFKEFFYTAEGMNAETIYKFEKGAKKVSTDRDALEKLATYRYCKPLARAVLAYRDVNKKLGVLKSPIDNDSRIRFQFKVAGTETGRWASSKTPWGTGTNGQNLTPEIRSAFVADPGMKLAYCDLSQAESRAVAYLSEDPDYIEACESGDVHTMVCRMVWPELAWTGNLKEDKAVAEQEFYRWFTYRDMGKRGQHGSNYYGAPSTMAKHLHIPTATMKDFQSRYFGAFPGISSWQKRVIQMVQIHALLTTPVGRKRCFWGRPDDQGTWREAIAFVPQSLIGDIMNRALLRIWRIMGLAKDVEILAQVHDAILFQFPEDREDEIIPRALSLMEIPVNINGRQMIIPGEAETGWNWGKFKEDKNPDGLKEWKGNDERQRQRQPSASFLDC